MKLSVATLCSLAPVVIAWAPPMESRASTRLEATSRREAMQFLLSGAALLPQVASAADSIDYARIQDLLGQTEQPQTQAYEPKSKRPTYLTDPTDEFKQNEAKSADFKRKQLKVKKDFQGLLDQLQELPNDEAALAKCLDSMRYMVKQEGGLPLGITKEDLVKQVRRRKGRKPRFWPTEVEIAYQDLVNEIILAQSPNVKVDNML